MFIEEARVGSVLRAPNLAEVHDLVVEDGNHFLVMEWIDGVDLGTWVRWHRDHGKATRWDLVAGIAVGILRGLAAAHERVLDDGTPAPVVHRDVSPHNVLLTLGGVVKLVDFGLSLAPDRRCESTDPGVVKGKMSYLAPEIVSGGRPIPASDLFACGSVMWEALVGRKLFDGANELEIFQRLRNCVVEPLRRARPDVPAPLANLVHRALAAEPEQRFPSAREFARQLGTALKKSTARKDLHVLVARSVAEARGELEASGRAGDPTTETPIPSVVGQPIPEEARKGLWHKLPSLFGRRRG
jgi:serine/threonine-protein kinase